MPGDLDCAATGKPPVCSAISSNYNSACMDAMMQ